jgi:hypothetical protein
MFFAHMFFVRPARAARSHSRQPHDDARFRIGSVIREHIETASPPFTLPVENGRLPGPALLESMRM